MASRLIDDFKESLGGVNRTRENVKNPIYKNSNTSWGENTEKDKEKEMTNNNTAGFFKTKSGREYYVNSLNDVMENIKKEQYGEVANDVEGQAVENSMSSGSSVRSFNLPINAINIEQAIFFEPEQNNLVDDYIGFNPNENEIAKRFPKKKLKLEDIVKVENRQSSAWQDVIPVVTGSLIPSNINGISDANKDNVGTSRGGKINAVRKQHPLTPRLNAVKIRIQANPYSFNQLEASYWSQHRLYNHFQSLNFFSAYSKGILLDCFRKDFVYTLIGGGVKAIKTKLDGSDVIDVTKKIQETEDSFEGLLLNSSMKVYRSSSALFKKVFGDTFTSFKGATAQEIVNIFTNIAINVTSNREFGGHPYKDVVIGLDYNSFVELKTILQPSTTMNSGYSLISSNQSAIQIAYEAFNQANATVGAESVVIVPLRPLSEVNVLTDENDAFRKFSIGSYSWEENTSGVKSNYKYRRKMVIFDKTKYVKPNVMMPTIMMTNKILNEIKDDTFMDKAIDIMQGTVQTSALDNELAIITQYTEIVTPDVNSNNGVIFEFDDEIVPTNADGSPVVNMDFISFDE